MRLYYIDIVRGFAVVWMLSFQLADALRLLNLYGVPELYTLSRLWTYLFWMVAGFSCVLMREKYNTKRFWRKVAWRFVEFSLIGWILMLVVPFNITEPWTGEAVASIGFNLVWFSLIVAFVSKREWVYVASLGIMLVLLKIVPLNVLFNPFEVLSFMLVGGLLAVNSPRSSTIRFKPLEFLGRHALLFYVGHFLMIALIQRVS